MSDRTYRFILVGAGGVGSWLAPGLARMLEWNAPNSLLMIVDGDTFEPKNKERQNFKAMGNKAEVLAAELADEFDRTFIIPRPSWVVESIDVAEGEKGEEDLEGEEENPIAEKIAAKDLLDEGDVVFAVVDNFAARKVLMDAAREFDNIDIFTGGNDDAFYASVYHYQRRDGQDITDHPVVMHPEYEDPPDRNPGDMSCQERAEIEGGTQLLATNMTVAAFLLGRTKKVILDGEDDKESEIYIDIGVGLAQAFDRSAEQLTLAQGV